MAWDRNKTTAVISLVILAGATWWLSKTLTVPEEKTAAPEDRGLDYYVENFNTTVMNAAGNPQYVLDGALLTHYQGGRPSLLQQPRLTQYLDNEVVVHTTANTGSLSTDGKELLMEGNVKITRNSPAKRNPDEVTTEKIIVLLDK